MRDVSPRECTLLPLLNSPQAGAQSRLAHGAGRTESLSPSPAHAGLISGKSLETDAMRKGTAIPSASVKWARRLPKHDRGAQAPAKEAGDARLPCVLLGRL